MSKQDGEDILLVEDDAGVARLICDKLDEDGRNVVLMGSGASALAWLEGNRPSLILLDFSLPDMTGFEFIAKLNARIGKLPPFIVATGSGDERVAIAMLKGGARDYLIKDSSFLDILPMTVGQVLDQLAAEKHLTELEQALRDSENSFRAVAETATDAIITINDKGQVVFWNNAAQKMFGYSRDEMIGQQLGRVMPTSLRDAHEGGMNRVIAGNKAKIIGQTVEVVGLTKDGSEFPIEISLAQWHAHDEIFFTAILRDISERKRMEDELRSQSHVLSERVKELDCLYGLSHLFETKGDSFDEILQGAVDLLPHALQFPEQACAHISLLDQDFYACDFKEAVWKQSYPIVIHGQPVGIVEVGYLKHIAADRSSLFLEEENRLLEIVAERLGRFIERKRVDEELRFANVSIERANRELRHAFTREQVLSRTDFLTETYNRRYFFELADLEFAEATRHDRPLSLIMLDIDHFKSINDEYGHQVGDDVLKNIAQTVQKQLRGVDILGRYGGEEFAILFPNSNAEEAAVAAERIRESIAAWRMETNGKTVNVTVSVGVAERFDHNQSFDRLVTYADKALYTAKESGRNRVVTFSSESKN